MRSWLKTGLLKNTIITNHNKHFETLQHCIGNTFYKRLCSEICQSSKSWRRNLVYTSFVATKHPVNNIAVLIMKILMANVFNLLFNRTPKRLPSSLPRLLRFSAVLAPVVVLLKSALNSWTTLLAPSSVTSRDLSVKTTFSAFSNLNVRLAASVKHAFF